MPLCDLRLAEDEARVYRLLLLHGPGLPIRKLPESTGLSESRLSDALAGLENRDLVQRRGTDACVVVARPPEQAFAGILAEHERQLAQARGRLDELCRIYDSRSTRSADVVDVVAGTESITRHFDQLQRLARSQVRGCDRPPYTQLRNEVHPVERDRLAAGVAYRIIYDPAVMALPEGVERLGGATRAGEQVRLLADLPIKLVIADDQLAMIALGQRDGSASVLLVHPSVLLDGLIAVFDTLWKFSTPLRSWSEVSASFREQDRQLLGLLAAGVTEEAMARRLGIGLRTVQRRIQELMEALGVATRFQAGVAAAKRGLL